MVYAPELSGEEWDALEAVDELREMGVTLFEEAEETVLRGGAVEEECDSVSFAVDAVARQTRREKPKRPGG